MKRRFNALTAETLAKNQDGEGVFFRNRYGRGTVYLSIHNFEKSLYAGAGGYEGDAWKIWSTVRPVSRIVRTGDKNVFVSEHHFADGRVGAILVNNSRTAFDGVVSVRGGWNITGSTTDDAALAVWDGGNRLKLSGNAGILLVLERK